MMRLLRSATPLATASIVSGSIPVARLLESLDNRLGFDVEGLGLRQELHGGLALIVVPAPGVVEGIMMAPVIPAGRRRLRQSRSGERALPGAGGHVERSIAVIIRQTTTEKLLTGGVQGLAGCPGVFRHGGVGGGGRGAMMAARRAAAVAGTLPGTAATVDDGRHSVNVR